MGIDRNPGAGSQVKEGGHDNKGVKGESGKPGAERGWEPRVKGIGIKKIKPLPGTLYMIVYNITVELANRYFPKGFRAANSYYID